MGMCVCACMRVSVCVCVCLCVHVSEMVKDGGNNDSEELLFNQKAISNGMTSRITFCDVFVWFTKSLADGKDNTERTIKKGEKLKSVEGHW